MNGISTRFIMKALDNALSDNVVGNCISPTNVREALINMVKETDLPDDTRSSTSSSSGHPPQGVSGAPQRRSPKRSSTPTRSRLNRCSRTTSTTPKRT
jgi:hypothetical protein